MENNELQVHIDSVIAQMQLQTISSDEEYQMAGEFLVKAKQTAKFVEEQFAESLEAAKEKKRQAEAERKAVDAEIKRFTTPLSKAESVVKRMMSDYQAEQERKRREETERRRREEEERRLTEAEETGDERVLDYPVAPEAPAAEKPKASGTYAVQVWKYEILDKRKINPGYLVPNERLIGQVVRSEKENAAAILGDGVRVYSETEIRART